MRSAKRYSSVIFITTKAVRSIPNINDFYQLIRFYNDIRSVETYFVTEPFTHPSAMLNSIRRYRSHFKVTKPYYNWMIVFDEELKHGSTCLINEKGIKDKVFPVSKYLIFSYKAISSESDLLRDVILKFLEDDPLINNWKTYYHCIFPGENKVCIAYALKAKNLKADFIYRRLMTIIIKGEIRFTFSAFNELFDAELLSIKWVKWALKYAVYCGYLTMCEVYFSKCDEDCIKELLILLPTFFKKYHIGENEKKQFNFVVNRSLSLNVAAKSKKNKIRLFFLDLDGTLINKTKGDDASVYSLNGERELWEAFFKEIRLINTNLSYDIKFGIATSRNRKGCTKALEVLNIFGLYKHFDDNLIFFTTSASKVRYVLELCAKSMNVDPADIFLIDDRAAKIKICYAEEKSVDQTQTMGKYNIIKFTDIESLTLLMREHYKSEKCKSKGASTTFRDKSSSSPVEHQCALFNKSQASEENPLEISPPQTSSLML